MKVLKGEINIKRFIYYFAITVVIGVLIYWGTQYNIWLIERASKSSERIPVLVFASIFPIAIGVILRLPILIMEIKDKKEWTLDWVKIIAIGIPALYVGLFPILSLTSFGMNLFFPGMTLATGNLGNTTLITTAGIVFGYVLIDSLKK